MSSAQRCNNYSEKLERLYGKKNVQANKISILTLIFYKKNSKSEE